MEKIDKIKLISKYNVELFKKRNSMEYDERLIKEFEDKLREIGAFEEACKFVEEEIRDEEEQKAINEACKKLFDILKDFNIWKTTKLKELLKEVEPILKKDISFIGRLDLYEDLMKLPKYKDLEERDKIRIAMQIGSLSL